MMINVKKYLKPNVTEGSLKGFYIVECVLKKTTCLLLAILPFTVHHALKP